MRGGPRHGRTQCGRACARSRRPVLSTPSPAPPLPKCLCQCCALAVRRHISTAVRSLPRQIARNTHLLEAACQQMRLSLCHKSLHSAAHCPTLCHERRCLDRGRPHEGTRNQWSLQSGNVFFCDRHDYTFDSNCNTSNSLPCYSSNIDGDKAYHLSCYVEWISEVSLYWRMLQKLCVKCLGLGSFVDTMIGVMLLTCPFFNQIAQFFDLDGLAQIIRHACLQTFFPITCQSVGGDGDHGELGFVIG